MKGAQGIINFWEILIPVALIIYGFVLWLYQPDFLSNKGLATEYTKKNRDTWREGNKFGGRLMLLDGVIIGIILLIRHFVFSGEIARWFILVQVVVEVVLIFSIVPLMNNHVKKKFHLK